MSDLTLRVQPVALAATIRPTVVTLTTKPLQLSPKPVTVTLAPRPVEVVVAPKPVTVQVTMAEQVHITISAIPDQPIRVPPRVLPEVVMVVEAPLLIRVAPRVITPFTLS